VIPAIAVADALRAEGAEVSFVGGQRAEAELVPQAGYELDTLKVEGISRTNPLKAARAAARAGLALGAARKILKQRRPDAVLGGGGYVAGPVGAAAVAQRIPLVLAEADSHLGLTNRLLASRARRVCLAFPLEGRDGVATDVDLLHHGRVRRLHDLGLAGRNDLAHPVGDFVDLRQARPKQQGQHADRGNQDQFAAGIELAKALEVIGKLSHDCSP